MPVAPPDAAGPLTAARPAALLAADPRSLSPRFTMRPLAALLTLPLLAPALAADPPDKAAAAELARLAGTWKAVKMTVGKKSVDLSAAKWAVTFKGDWWGIATPEGKGGGTVQLDLSKTPHCLDLVSKWQSLG